MPIFEYKCSQCGFINEVLVKSSDTEAPACPECSSKKVEKLFSNFAAVVKENHTRTSRQKCQTCPNAGQCSDFSG